MEDVGDAELLRLRTELQQARALHAKADEQRRVFASELETVRALLVTSEVRCGFQLLC
jgi:hypothetical protein